jgi:hypothetical protein
MLAFSDSKDCAASAAAFVVTVPAAPSVACRRSAVDAGDIGSGDELEAASLSCEPVVPVEVVDEVLGAGVAATSGVLLVSTFAEV